MLEEEDVIWVCYKLGWNHVHIIWHHLFKVGRFEWVVVVAGVEEIYLGGRWDFWMEIDWGRDGSNVRSVLQHNIICC